MDSDEIYGIIRSGSPEGRELLDNIIHGYKRGMLVSVMARNFSHNIGPNIKKYQI